MTDPKQEAQEFMDRWKQEYFFGYSEREWLTSDTYSPNPGYVYFLKAGPYYKIGRTSDVLRRFPQINLKMPFEVRLWAVWWADDMVELEQLAHDFYAKYHVNGEWFELPPREAERIREMNPHGEFWGAVYDMMDIDLPKEFFGRFDHAQRMLDLFFNWWYATRPKGDKSAPHS